jgi:hypothetical protein
MLCDSSEFGATAAIKYQVLDQDGTALPSSHMEPQEEVLNYFRNGTELPAQELTTWGDIGGSGYPGSNVLTDSSGQFLDAPLNVCTETAMTGTNIITANQIISVLLGEKRYPLSGVLRNNAWTFQSASAGHGQMCNSQASACAGADINVTQ